MHADLKGSINMKNLRKLLVALGETFKGKIDQLVVIISALLAAMLIWNGAEPAVILSGIIVLHLIYLFHRILDRF